MASHEETEALNSTRDEKSSQLPLPNSTGGDNDAERQRFLPSAAEDLAAETAGRSPDDEVPHDVSPKHVTLDELARREPPDRFNLVYVIMVVHGIGLLMPWNMFITAKSYFEDHKLYEGNQTSPQVLEYRTNFMSYVGIASQFPSTVMNLVNLFFQCGRGKPTIRIVASIAVIIVVFVITLVLAMVDSSQWPDLFFWLTMVSAVIINSAGGVYQNSLYGVVAMLPMKYTNAVIFGNNVSGTFVSVLSIIMLAVTPNIRSSALYYFLAAVIVLLIAMDCHFLLPHTKFFRHYKQLMSLKKAQRQRSEPQETCHSRLTSYWEVFKQIWILALCVWFVFFVSLALFPQIQSDIKRRSFPMDDLYWTPVFCYLSFNLFAMLGNLLTELVHTPGPKWVWIPVLARVAFIPLYLMFNFRPDTRSWPAPIANDYVFIICSVLMAFSGGYLSSLCMMYAPAQVDGHNAGTAGMMMSFFLVLGILSGVNASRLLATLV